MSATGAKAVIRNGQIVISIEVDALPLIVSGSCATPGAMQGLWKVTDAEAFAREVCHSLNDEREDGTTRVHLMFDGAFMHAIEQGAEGIDEVGGAEFERESARLQRWAQAAVSTAEQVGIPASCRDEPKDRHQPTTPGEQGEAQYGARACGMRRAG